MTALITAIEASLLLLIIFAIVGYFVTGVVLAGIFLLVTNVIERIWRCVKDDV